MANEKASAVQTKSSGFNPVQFLREVSAEMKKVSWSTKEELARYTVVVSITVFIVCSLIWICDTFFARLFNLILR
ncbi:preprotein translocase subunit SecE [uncultured Anaerovibrio sp.]|uniref:preprotein translocase subunit SecE n=1 Tax=Anaerovibrio sp. TaxID=1872532 RepID=UPI002627BCEB|nr:preprotein translocase subunit SecE [uncultured Anaerovibrio sp.]